MMNNVQLIKFLDIPILHDYHCNKESCDGNFASFNSINSKSFNEELKPLMGDNWW